MQLEVYQTDAEAYEAAAALAAERLVEAARARTAALALPGGRSGRALMLALAGRGEIPWSRLEVFFTDECCLPEGDPRRTVAVARESLLGPRGIVADRIHAIGGEDAASGAVSYAALLERALGAPPVLDVVLLVLGDAGEVAAVMPGSSAAGSRESVAAVDAAEVAIEPRVARVTLTGSTLRAARHVIVTATGATRAGALASAFRDPVDPLHRPAQAVLPSVTASWFVDRAAAGVLLRDARRAG